MSPFQSALQRGLESSEKISPVNKALEALGPDFKITSVEDANALADAVISAAEKNPELLIFEKVM